MTIRFALLAAALLATPLHAASGRKAAAPVLHEIERVAITTELGVITLDLEGRKAPVSTANFLRYVDAKRFDGIVFYRAMKLKWGEPPNGLVQAGVRGDPRKTFAPVAHEPTSETGVSHSAGAISLARMAPGTATGDFSILVSKLEGLDADPKGADAEARAGYAAFGHVVEGMDVVRRIWERPVDPNKGTGGLKGQMLVAPVKVLRVRRVALPPAGPAPVAP